MIKKLIGILCILLYPCRKFPKNWILCVRVLKQTHTPSPGTVLSDFPVNTALQPSTISKPLLPQLSYPFVNFCNNISKILYIHVTFSYFFGIIYVYYTGHHKSTKTSIIQPYIHNIRR